MEDSDLPLSSSRKKQKIDDARLEPSHANHPSGTFTQNASVVMNQPSPHEDALLVASMAAQDEATSLESTIQAPIATPDVSRSKELQVGIKELVNPGLPGFSGVLKKRYTDFLVNEILPSGDVVHLNDLKPPRKSKEPEPSTHVEDSASATASVAPVQGESVTYPAPPEPLHDETSLRNGQSSQAVGQEVPQLATGLQDAPNPSKNAFPEPGKDLNHWQAFAKAQPSVQLSAENSEILHSYFDPDVVTQLLALFNRVIDSPHRKVKEYGIVNAGKITDRQKRTKIHQDLRNIFSSRLESATDENGALMVTAAVTKGSMDSRNDRGGGSQRRGGHRNRGRGGRGGHEGGFDRGQQQRRLTWQELGGEYLHFTVYKENKDTMEVMSFLSRELHIRPQGFQFAGTKDRRAITVQRASVHRVRAEHLAQIGRNLRHSHIGNFQYQKQGLDLGDLLGNEFVITLRDCQFTGLAEKDKDEGLELARQIIQDAAKHLGEEGFINYYGLQRFGTYATRTDAVGLKMLQSDFKGAVAAILEFAPEALAAAKDPLSANTTVSSDDKARAWAIDKFQQTGRNRPALDELPKKFSAEASIIRHLGDPNYRNDFQGALKLINRNLRLMYVHAYQSLVWNLAASERWARYRKDAVEGDLVLVNESKDKEDLNNAVEAEEELDSEGVVIIRPAAHDSSRSEEDRFERARPLTDEEAKSGRYTIFDVVLPTPGFDVLYPANEVGDFYTKYMKSEAGGGIDPDDMRRTWKDISLSGNYRKLIAKPLKAIEVEVRSYFKEDEQFVETDMDRLEKSKESDHAHPVSIKSTSSATADSSSAKPPDVTDQQPQPEIDHAVSDPEVKKETADCIAPITEAASSGTLGEALAEQAANSDAVPKQDESIGTYKIAVILKLQLGSSQYATMALRELMKEGGVRVYKPDFGSGR